jgi:hypothetical protein
MNLAQRLRILLVQLRDQTRAKVGGGRHLSVHIDPVALIRDGPRRLRTNAFCGLEIPGRSGENGTRRTEGRYQRPYPDGADLLHHVQCDIGVAFLHPDTPIFWRKLR